jgi:hypothetical protein
MEAKSSSETSADFQQSTRRYIPEEGTLQSLDFSGMIEGKFYKHGILEIIFMSRKFFTEVLDLLSRNYTLCKNLGAIMSREAVSKDGRN